MTGRLLPVGLAIVTSVCQACASDGDRPAPASDGHERGAPTLVDLAARGAPKPWTRAEHRTWAAKVSSRVREAWSRAAGGGSAPVGRVVVRFTVMPDGRVSSAALAETSGKAALDRLAVEAIRKLGRLPPPPTGRLETVTVPLRVAG